MGQPIAVTERPSTRHGLVRFDINRTLTGMGHVRYSSVADADSDLITDELARRLFATGSVSSIHMYANVITVALAPGHTSDGLADVITALHLHWLPGVEPPVFDEEPAPES